jgi:glutamyl-tRNA reductase
MELTGFEIEVHPSEAREAVVSDLRACTRNPMMVLDTCQRLEVFGIAEPIPVNSATYTRRWNAQDAFERLVRIAAGVESRILGELEVLGQVREAYRSFRQITAGNEVALDGMFQDALALARKARKDSGIDRELTSIGALAARMLIESVPDGKPLAVIGAGSLAGSIARYLGKRGNSPIHVASRCPENALRLAEKVGGFGVGLDAMTGQLSQAWGIVCATAAPHPVVYDHHLGSEERPLMIIDLGVPPDCEEKVAQRPGITYVPLSEIEQKANVNTAKRESAAKTAAARIREGAAAWYAGRSVSSVREISANAS